MFGLWWILLDVIITSPHTEVTLDTFGFLVGAHSTAWRAIMRPPMAKMALFGDKNAVFWLKIYVLETSSNLFDTIMTGHKKYNFFVLTSLHGGPWEGRRG